MFSPLFEGIKIISMFSLKGLRSFSNFFITKNKKKIYKNKTKERQSRERLQPFLFTCQFKNPSFLSDLCKAL